MEGYLEETEGHEEDLDDGSHVRRDRFGPTQSVSTVVLQKSTPPQIRQRILCYY